MAIQHAGRRRHSPRFMLVVGLLGLSLMGTRATVYPPKRKHQSGMLRPSFKPFSNV